MEIKLKEDHFYIIRKYISKIREKNENINLLFRCLESYGDLILIGGAIRDLAIYNKIPRDFDIILDSPCNLCHILDGFVYQQNRFGGYKINIDCFEFDVWTINETWAFKYKILEPDIENLKESTFYNVDSIWLNLNSGYWEAQYFNQAMECHLLDIVIEDKYIQENPTPEINIIRAFIICKELGLNISPRVNEYIKIWIENTINPLFVLQQALLNHYGNSKYLSNQELSSFLLDNS